MRITGKRREQPRQPKSVLMAEIVGFVLVVVIAVDELARSSDAHLWIGIVLGIGAIFGACGYLLHDRSRRQS